MPLTPPAPPSARARIGGRWAVSVRLAVVSVALMAIAALAQRVGVGLDPFGLPPAGPLAVALQGAGICALILVAHLTVFRHRAERPVPVVAVFALGVLGGAVRLVVPPLLDAGRSVREDDVATTVIGVVAVLGLASLVPPVVAYLTATREWYVVERDRLLARLAAAEAERLRAVGGLRDLALATVQADLDEARAVLARPGARPDDVASALLAAARGGVRPAAHDVFERPAPAPPRVSMREVLTRELRRAPLPILVPAVGFAVLVAPRALVAQGPLAALALPALVVAGILVAFPVGRRLVRRAPRLGLPISLLACIVAVAPAALAVPLGVRIDAPGAVYTLATAVLFGLVLLAGAVRTAEALGEEVLAGLGEPIREAELERAAADRARDLLAREIALHLHGVVQSGLVAASYAIQDAIAEGDDAALDVALARARDVLERGVGAEAPADGDDGGLAVLEREWEDLLAVKWAVTDADDAHVRLAADVVRECLANAVVHGRASAARVAIAPGPGLLVVEVVDDGRGPQGGAPGLGSAVLARDASLGWEIAAGPDGGTRVVARLPLLAG